MKLNFWTIEKTILAVLLVLAIGYRFLNLGAVPLNDLEAVAALDGWNLSEGVMVKHSSQPFISNLLGLLFFVIPRNNFVTRFFPALIGVVVIFLPLLFRKQLPEKIVFLLIFWFLIEPGFVALSRQINSTLMMFLFGMIAFHAMLEKKAVLLGISFAIAFLCGASFWWALIPAGFAALVQKKMGSRSEDLGEQMSSSQMNWKKAAIASVVALVFGGTFGFVFPSQFGSTFSGLTDFLSGWTPDISTVAQSFNWRVIPFYELPVYLFGILGLVWMMVKKHSYRFFLISWFVAAFILFVVYPQKNVEYLFWVNLPLLFSSTIFLASMLKIDAEERILIGKIAMGGLIISIFLSQIILYIIFRSIPMQGAATYILLAVGVLLFVFAFFMLGWTYSWNLALRSLVLMAVIDFAFLTISASWNAGMLRTPYHNEMWSLSPQPVDYDIFIETLEQQVKWPVGGNENIHVQLQGLKSASLEWALLPYDLLQEGENINFEKDPEVIISNEYQTITANSDYRGQDFVWLSEPPWSSMFTNEWLSWLMTRDAPQDGFFASRIIVWVRSDLFTGKNLTSNTIP
ncbi:MAG: hypothetical protein CVU39_06115 [Chloroflexi bacterium HGW-Chloroflexi-10]|nr:MAG: hypothetical protein CVU39_06115 [Chloroflexi bacterium HGW-Chloroflexi-10]